MQRRSLTILLCAFLFLLPGLSMTVRAAATPADLPAAAAVPADSQVESYTVGGRVVDGSGNGIAGVAVTGTGSMTMVLVPQMVVTVVAGSERSQARADTASLANGEPWASSTASRAGPSALRPPLRAAQIFTATTDAEGQYLLADLPAGRYGITPRRSGWGIGAVLVTVPPGAVELVHLGAYAGPDNVEEIFIPAGTFQMGCDRENPEENCLFADELPLHTVYLDGYYIDKYEVTHGRYRDCMFGGGCSPAVGALSVTELAAMAHPQNADLPMIRLDWFHARDFCAWAGKRLPSEAEWEKAARGSEDTRKYPWGDEPPTCELANYSSCVGDIAPVGSFPAGASAYGVMDMAGNALEWVNDWYQADYYSVSPEQNPQGPETGMNRVLRGGLWYFGGLGMRTAARSNIYPDIWEDVLGFRCARTP